MQAKCSVKGCNKEVYVKKHMLCVPHYARLKRKGNPGEAAVLVRTPIPAWRPDEDEKRAILR